MASNEEYLEVLKASYDYEPQSEDEIAIKEDQLLFLLERTDDEQVITAGSLRGKLTNSARFLGGGRSK